MRIRENNFSAVTVLWLIYENLNLQSNEQTKAEKKAFKSVLDNYTEGEFLQIELEQEQMLVFLIESNFIRYLVSLNFLLNKTF